MMQKNSALGLSYQGGLRPVRQCQEKKDIQAKRELTPKQYCQREPKQGSCPEARGTLPVMGQWRHLCICKLKKKKNITLFKKKKKKHSSLEALEPPVDYLSLTSLRHGQRSLSLSLPPPFFSHLLSASPRRNFKVVMCTASKGLPR